MSFSSVCVVGLGYIGLPTASLLASNGFSVLGVDINERVVETLRKGKILIHEPGLGDLVEAGVRAGRLRASASPETSDVFIIAVPTPFREGKKPDLSYVESAACAVAPFLHPGSLVILESTSPVGTTERIRDIIRESRPDLALPDYPCVGMEQVYVAHCPERVLPGRILQELTDNDRIIGGLDSISTLKAAEFYRSFVKGEVHTTNARSAELVKLTENAFRDVNIAFANELALICEEFDLNVWEVISLANRHPRVAVLRPGPGVGGHCIAVDPWFIVDSAPTASRLIRTAREINDARPAHIINKVRERIAHLKSPRIACLGLAFKADIDDLRESPALHIVEKLAEFPEADILVAEPYIQQLPSSLSERCNVRLTTVEEAITQADVILILTDHSLFRNMKNAFPPSQNIIDTRGILQPDLLA